MEIIEGLVDSHFNGVDLLWLVFAVGLAVTAQLCADHARRVYIRASDDLERAAFMAVLTPDIMDPDLDVDLLFTWPDTTYYRGEDGVRMVEPKTRRVAPPPDTAGRQAAAYLYLGGSGSRHELTHG